VSLSFADPTSVSFIDQTPADLDSLNVISIPMNITYTITNTAGINASSVKIYLKTNNTVNDISSYTNGVANIGWEVYPYRSVSGDDYSFALDDNDVYPHTENREADLFRNVVHNSTILTSQNHYYITELLNISNVSQYSFYEQMLNSSTATPVRMYICNSSYTTGNPTVNSNCALLTSIVSTTYNHSHNLSLHQVIPFAISNGLISGIKVTPKMFFLVRGNNGANVYIWQTSPASRTGVSKISTNNGATWTNQAVTTDAHLHQYANDDALWYYVCANSTDGNYACSDIRYDLIEQGGIPPTPAVVTSPINTTYILGSLVGNNSLWISYLPSVSPNAYAIVNYNITLLDASYNYVMDINVANGVDLNYTFNTAPVDSGQYIVAVESTDALSQTAIGYSPVFTIIKSDSLNFSSPTPDNQVPYGGAFFIINLTDISPMDWCNIEVDGINNSGTLSGDALSCSYEIPYANKYVGHNYSIRGYDSVSSVEYKTGLRIIPYYGCGYVNESVTLQTNVSFRNDWNCWYVIAHYITLDGNGYTVDGSDGLGGLIYPNGVEAADFTTDFTIKNLKAQNFFFGIGCGDSCTNVMVENNTLTNIYFQAINVGATFNGTIRNNVIEGVTGGSGITLDNSYDYSIYAYNNIIRNNGVGNPYGIILAATGTDIYIYNNTLYNAGLTGIYATASAPGNLGSVFISDNNVFGSEKGIDAQAMANVTLSGNTIRNSSILGMRLANELTTIYDNVYVDNTVALDFDNAFFGNQYITASNELVSGTRIDITDVQDSGEIYYISPTVVNTLPLGKANVGNQHVNLAFINGAPSIDNMIFHWRNSDVMTINETTITLENYDGFSWTNIGDPPNIITNVIQANNIVIAGDIVILGDVGTNPSAINIFPLGSDNQSIIPEIFWIFLLCVASLLILAEVSHNNMWGIICGLLFIIAASMIATNGYNLEMKTGANYTTYDGSSFNYSIGTATTVQDEVYNYSPIPFMMPQMPTIVFFLMGIALIWGYALKRT
jgi:hypothetical protein